MKKRILYGSLLLVAVLAIGAAIATSSYAQSFLNRNQETAQTGEDDVLPGVTTPNSIVVEAKVVPNREADLSLAAGGIVTEVLVAEGDSVAAGTPLVRLNAARQQAAVAQTEANLRAAESTLAGVQAPPRPQEVARAQAALTSAQAALQQVRNGPNQAEITAARVDLANAEAALRQAQSEYDKVSWANDISMLPQATALEQATNNYVRAEAALAELDAGADAEDIVQAQAQVSQFQANLNLLLAGVTDAEIAAAESNVAATQAALRDAQIALNDMTLVAPFDGTVAVVTVEVGEPVVPGVAAVRLADFSKWRIETEDLTEMDVVDVAPGAPVAITFDALPAEEFSGRVVSIRPLGENKQGDITYTVVVEMDRQDPRLRWNMTAETTILPPDMAAKVPGKAAPAPEPDRAPVGTTSLAASENMPTQTQPIAETAAPVVTATVLTGGATLNVRGGPGTAYPVLGSVRSLETLTVVGRDGAGSWLLVALSEGRTGWVSVDYTVVKGDLESLPVLEQGVEATTQPSPIPSSPDQSSKVQPARTGPAAYSAATTQGADGLTGTLVFQTSTGGDIYVYELETGELRRLTYGMDPALSPDGQTVALVRAGGEHGLYLVGIDGTNERRIFSGGENLRSPSWSPDGQWIVFSRRTGEFTCREVGSGLCYPDNPFLDDLTLVSKPETGLSVVDRNGQNFRDLPALNTAAAPAWGSSGIVYQSRSGIQLTGDQPGATTQAVVSEFRYQDPMLSPDGGRILFFSVEGNHREIFTVNGDGTGLQALTRPPDLLAKEYPQNAAPAWSPEEEQIAFVSNRTAEGRVGAWSIWVMNSDGSNLRRLPIDVEMQYTFQAEQVLSWQ